MEFGKWQEQKYEDQPGAMGTVPKEVDTLGNQVMVSLYSSALLISFSLCSDLQASVEILRPEVRRVFP